MSLTPIFDEVCADLGYKPIQTTGLLLDPFTRGRWFAYDLLLLNPPRLPLMFGGIA